MNRVDTWQIEVAWWQLGVSWNLHVSVWLCSDWV